MTRAECYRANAAAREETARNARDPTVKRQFEEIALEWRALADHADKDGR